MSILESLQMLGISDSGEDRFEPHDAVQRGWHAAAACRVRAQGERHHTGSDGDRATGAAASDDVLLGVDAVARAVRGSPNRDTRPSKGAKGPGVRPRQVPQPASLARVGDVVMGPVTGLAVVGIVGRNERLAVYR